MHTAKWSRRRVLRAAAAGLVVIPSGLTSNLWAAPREHELPELPYPRDALVPYISKETLDYHYGKHHKGYVVNLNKLIPGTPFENQSLEDIVKNAPPGPIFNNAAQVWNHTFFWNSLSPKGGGEPGGPLAQAIKQSFGSYTDFKKQFSEAATKLFGSGWVWLVKGKQGLEIASMGNAGTPLKAGQPALLTLDVWEHAYYIDYRNARPAFVDAFWKIVNWKFAEKNFQ